MRVPEYDHETMRNEQADRELDLQAALIQAKQENDRDRIHRPRALAAIPEYMNRPIYWRVA